MSTSEKPSYVAGHVLEALTHSGETDVDVKVTDHALVITGHVSTDVRRDAVAAIARALAGDLQCVNEVEVLHLVEPDGEETIS